MDERRSAWADPRVIVSVVGLFIGVFQAFIAVCGLAVVIAGGLLGSFIFLRTQATTSQISNATLNDQLIEIKGQVSSINGKLDANSNDLRVAVNENIRQDGKLEQLDKRVSSIEGDLKTNAVYNTEVVALRSDVDALKAKEK